MVCVFKKLAYFGLVLTPTHRDLGYKHLEAKAFQAFRTPGTKLSEPDLIKWFQEVLPDNANDTTGADDVVEVATVTYHIGDRDKSMPTLPKTLQAKTTKQPGSAAARRPLNPGRRVRKPSASPQHSRPKISTIAAATSVDEEPEVEEIQSGGDDDEPQATAAVDVDDVEDAAAVRSVQSQQSAKAAEAAEARRAQPAGSAVIEKKKPTAAAAAPAAAARPSPPNIKRPRLGPPTSKAGNLKSREAILAKVAAMQEKAQAGKS